MWRQGKQRRDQSAAHALIVDCILYDCLLNFSVGDASPQDLDKLSELFKRVG